MCMENTAQGGILRVNIAQGEAKRCIYLKTPLSAVFSVRNELRLCLYFKIQPNVAGRCHSGDRS